MMHGRGDSINPSFLRRNFFYSYFFVISLIQSKGIDADKSPPCPTADEGNGYCRGFHDGWRQAILDRLD
jgi:hypothetical protein